MASLSQSPRETTPTPVTVGLGSEDLPCEEKPSSDLSGASHGPSQQQPDEEAPKPYDTNHVLAWRDPGLPTPVYVRMDSSGVFHTYPTLGDKPFQSLDQVQSAVA